jgi:alpha-mannosidase
VTARYRWPAAAVGDGRSCAARSSDTVDTDVRTTLELRTGERFLRVHVELDNRARDHRLRAHFPLPAAVDGSDAECAFTVVHRGLVAEGGPHEAALATYVSRRFVDCSDGDVGLALVHDGLLEYEVVTGRGSSGAPAGTELALTLVRATGYLSRTELARRPDPAGPNLPLEGPQLQRRLALDYAVVPHRGDWASSRLYDVADAFLVPLVTARATGSVDAGLGATGALLAVEGAEVSAVTRAAPGAPLTVRLFNPSPRATVARIHVRGEPASGELVDLVGAPRGDLHGTLTLGPFEIATVTISG